MVKSVFKPGKSSVRYFNQSAKRRRMYFDNEYIKIYREHIFCGDGVFNTFVTLLSRLAYSEGYIKYNNYYNHVSAGEYKGGKGFFKYLKNCDGKHTLSQSLELLCNNNVISCENNKKTHTFSIKLNECLTKKVFSFSDYSKELADYRDNIPVEFLHSPTTTKGFFCLPRNLYSVLNISRYRMTETDVIWDIITSMVADDGLVCGSNNATVFAPIDKEGNVHNLVSYTFLAERWGWSRAKVCRFFKKFSSYFKVKKVGSNKGSLISCTREFFNSYLLLDASYFNQEKEEKVAANAREKKESYPKKQDKKSCRSVFPKFFASETGIEFALFSYIKEALCLSVFKCEFGERILLL